MRSIHADRKRAASPFFAPQPPQSHLLTTPGGHISRVKDVDETPKSSVLGASFNLINAIVGAGIVGIPFAINQCSLILGVFTVILFAVLTVKSLRLLVETAKHVDVSTYERLAEASFGKAGFNSISIAMFIMSYGAMVGYLMIIKTNLSYLLGVDEENKELRRAVLVVASLLVIMPLSLQRDMSNLSKTSAISVTFDIILVGIIAVFSPVKESVSEAGGIKQLLEDSTPDISTFFTGIGVLCFAFVCQHSAFIIAASLENPTRERWIKVTGLALGTCCFLATVMGICGYLGFMDDTNGDILENLGEAALSRGGSFQMASNIARGLLSTTMFFVYPMELFVARHVCVVMFFKGRRAHEGDDHSVLARKDRRVSVTVFLYIISIVPALLCDDLGSVFSISGSLGGAFLSYVGPGITYIAVHGEDLLELASQYWDYVPKQMYPDGDNSLSTTPTTLSTFSAPRRILHPESPKKNDEETGLLGRKAVPAEKGCFRKGFDCIMWYLLGMPIWCKVALYGRENLKKHKESEALKSPMPYALGKIVHHSKPMFGSHLMRPNLGRPNDSDDDSIPGRRGKLVRTFSNPTMYEGGKTREAFRNLPNAASIKLPPLVPVPKKSKVGFSLGPEHSAANEKVALDRSNPISQSSFSSASFEVMRDGHQTSYGSTSNKILQEVKEIKRHSSSGVSEIDDQGSLDDGLTFDDGEEASEGSSVYVGDDDENDDTLELLSRHSDDSEELRSIQNMRQKPIVSSVKLVDKIPDLDKVKLNPDVKRRMRTSGLIASIQAEKNATEKGEDDPQDDMPSIFDFFIAVTYIMFGAIAACAGLWSSL